MTEQQERVLQAARIWAKAESDNIDGETADLHQAIFAMVEAEQ